MITALLASLAVSAAPPSLCGSPAIRMPGDTLQSIYQGGTSFTDFLASAQARRDQWLDNYALAESMDATMVARAAAVSGQWRILVVAIDTCSDSVNSVPWIARLSEHLDNVELRVVTPDQGGRALMEAHRTPDGRAATPTVLLLDDDWQVRGCFIERPPALRAHLDSIPSDRSTAARMDWYRDDAGRTTVQEMVSMLEAAARGEVQCR